jgi:serine/threonine protein kinase
MELEAGLLLGERYRLVNRIANGALGELWRAADRVPRCWVALRRITSHAENRTGLDSFLGEMRLLRAVRHPAVAKIVGVSSRSAPFGWVASELLQGETLDQLLERRGSIVSGGALRLISELARGLAEVHALGIAHRGIQPRSIILHREPTGGITSKLVDFGAIRLLGSGPTTAYTSPEQHSRRAPIDAASDVWSLGVLLFRCVTGRLPFGSSEEVNDAVISAILEDEGDLDSGTRSLIADCLRRAPDQRPDALELADRAQLAAWTAIGGYRDLEKMVRIPDYPWLSPPEDGEHFQTIPNLLGGPPPRRSTVPSLPTPCDAVASLESDELAVDDADLEEVSPLNADETPTPNDGLAPRSVVRNTPAPAPVGRATPLPDELFVDFRPRKPARRLVLATFAVVASFAIGASLPRTKHRAAKLAPAVENGDSKSEVAVARAHGKPARATLPAHAATVATITGQAVNAVAKRARATVQESSPPRNQPKSAAVRANVVVETKIPANAGVPLWEPKKHVDSNDNPYE